MTIRSNNVLVRALRRAYDNRPAWLKAAQPAPARHYDAVDALTRQQEAQRILDAERAVAASREHVRTVEAALSDHDETLPTWEQLRDAARKAAANAPKPHDEGLTIPPVYADALAAIPDKLTGISDYNSALITPLPTSPVEAGVATPESLVPLIDGKLPATVTETIKQEDVEHVEVTDITPPTLLPEKPLHRRVITSEQRERKNAQARAKTRAKRQAKALEHAS